LSSNARSVAGSADQLFRKAVAVNGPVLFWVSST
jgi:hypothetical protein